MEIALMIVLLVVCVALTAVVTAQVDRGEGMSGAVTGQSSSFGKNKKADKADILKKITIVISVVFAVLVILVNIVIK